MIRLFFLFTLVSFSAHAGNTEATAALNTAKVAFAKRTPFTKDEAAVDAAQGALDSALTQASDLNLKYQIMVYETRVLVWKGLHTTVFKPEDIYAQAFNLADQARNLNNGAFVNFAEAQYWYSAALGRWALEKGALTVLGHKGEMTKALDNAINGQTLDGQLGETVESYGPHRVYGRMYMELPGLAGGSVAKALEETTTAYTSAKDHTLNELYYAEALDKNGKTTDACNVLKDLLAKDPKSLISDRWQDATEDQADAKKLSDEKCK